MPAHQASRTLLKSSPELWAECSDAASLARHLGQIDQIRITKLEPETAVAWEGTAASGTVRLEPSEWGTRVTLTLEGEEAAPQLSPPQEPQSRPAEEPAAEPPPPPAQVPPPGAFGWLRSLFRRRPVPAPEPAAAPVADPAPVAEAPAPDPPSPPATPQRSGPDLDAALDSLGSAHHRPYSRA
jgi:hypothetical protein